VGAPIGVNFSQEGPVFKCSRLRPGARPAICHPERSEGSLAGPSGDPKLALRMTAVLKFTPMVGVPGSQEGETGAPDIGWHNDSEERKEA